MASILIIDDDPQIHSLFGQVLERIGHRVLTASDGNQGLLVFRQKLIDLVITDVFLPEKGGLWVILALRRESSTVPIIAFAGGAEGDQFLEMAKLLGAQRTLVKPFPVSKLIHAVQQELLWNEGPKHVAARGETIS